MARGKKKNKIDGYKIAERGLGGFIYYAIEALIIVGIIFLFIKGFSVSFKFAYDVFSDKAKNPASKDTVVVEIPMDSSATEISEIIFDSGVIDNKYVMMAKIKIGGYGKDVKAGSYGMSPSMKYGDIIDMICGYNENKEEEDEDDANDKIKVDTGVDVYDSGETGDESGGEDMPTDGETVDGGDADGGDAEGGDADGGDADE